MGERTCSEPGCPEPAHARGFCGKHYTQHYRAGTLPRRQYNWSRTGPDGKTCNACGATKPLEMFSLSSSSGKRSPKPIYRSSCKTCQAAQAMEWFHNNRARADANAWRNNLQKLYGLTPEDYQKMLAAQGGVCAICGKDEPTEHGRTGTKFRLGVDHCHDSGRVRGLLCQRCNRAIGLLDDDPALLQRAITYLSKGLPMTD